MVGKEIELDVEAVIDSSTKLVEIVSQVRAED
jgi:hypothetical protein